MTPFALATVQTGAGPAAAIRVDGRLHLLAEAEPSLIHTSVRDLLEDWFRFFDRLVAVADTIASHPDRSERRDRPIRPATSWISRPLGRTYEHFPE